MTNETKSPHESPFQISEVQVSEMQESEPTLKVFASFHAPAILYGFGRELIADLGRRSKMDAALLPVLDFTKLDAVNVEVSDSTSDQEQ